jgi:hypothetical protein
LVDVVTPGKEPDWEEAPNIVKNMWVAYSVLLLVLIGWDETFKSKAWR